LTVLAHPAVNASIRSLKGGGLLSIANEPGLDQKI
jgi:hypothetical protein